MMYETFCSQHVAVELVVLDQEQRRSVAAIRRGPGGFTHDALPLTWWTSTGSSIPRIFSVRLSPSS